MAPSTISVASAGCVVSAPVNSSTLSSRSPFGTSLVQLAPVRRSVGNANRLVVVRANLSEEQPATGKKVLASFLAAGAALSIAGAALAGNPVDFAKGKADEALSSAQSATSGLPQLPKIELPNAGVLQDAGKAARGAVKDVQGRVDGIFGQNKPYKGRVASTNGGTGSAIGDAQKRLSNFGKNPFAENLTKTTEEFNASIGKATGEKSGSARANKELLGQDSTRVDAATEKVKELQDNFRNKAGDALDEAKAFVGSAQNAAPDLPSIPTPELPRVPNPLEGLKKNVQDIEGKAESVKGDVASKASSAVNGTAGDAVQGVKSFVGSAKNDLADNLSSKGDEVKGDVASKASSISNSTPSDVADGAKNLVGSAQDATSNFPSLPNPLEGFSKSVQGKADDVKASKVDDVKGDVSLKASSLSNSTPSDAVDDAKNLAGSAQDATSNFASFPNPFEGLSKNIQGKAVDVKDTVALKVDDVKGDVWSKASSLSNSTPDDVADGAKNLVGSAQKATSNFPSFLNPFEGLNKNVQGAKEKAADVKADVASKADQTEGEVSSEASSTMKKNAGDVLDESKTFVGSAAQDSTPSLPNFPNPFEGFNKNAQNLKEKASDVTGDVASKAEDMKGDVSAKAPAVLE